MVYSHKTCELAALEVENVMNIDILIVVSSITVSKDCCLLLWYFQPKELLSTCCTFVAQWCKRKKINESGNRLITIMQICNAGFTTQTSTSVDSDSVNNDCVNRQMKVSSALLWVCVLTQPTDTVTVPQASLCSIKYKSHSEPCYKVYVSLGFWGCYYRTLRN